MAARATRVNVTDVPARLDSPPFPTARRLVLRNRGTVSIYIGGPEVTTGVGYEVAANAELSLDLAVNDTLYGVAVAQAGVAVQVLQLGI